MRSLAHQIRLFIETRRGALLALLLVYAAAVLLNLTLTGATIYGPIHFDDELRYWDTVRALYDGSFNLREFSHSPPLYPIALLPAWLLFPINQAYQAAQVLNFVYITSIIFPCYFIMRSFAGRGLSVLVASLVLLFPTQVVMPRSMISENLFYPLFLWVTCLAFRNFTHETSRWRLAENILFGLLCGLLVLTRYIGLAVVPAFSLIWWLKPLDAHDPTEKLPLLLSKRKLLHAASVALPFVLVIAVWVLLGLRENVPVKELLGFGIAGDPNPAQLGRRRFVMWGIFYLSYTLLMAAPYLGIIATAIVQLRWKEWRSPVNRWLIGTALICGFLLLACVRHSWRAAYNYPDPLKIQGRYILYFVPLFLITTFVLLNKINLPRLSKSGFALAVVVVGELVAVAYLMIYRGLFYLEEPLGISVNSADGLFIYSLGNLFLPFFIGLLLTSILILFTTRGKKPILSIYVILLVIFYLLGNVKLYTSLLVPVQHNNFQAIQLTNAIQRNHNNPSEVFYAPLRLLVANIIDEDDCLDWTSTLWFNGFTNVECVRTGESGGGGDPTIFVAQILDDRYVLRSLDSQPVDVEGSVMFQFNGKNYVIEQQ